MTSVSIVTITQYSRFNCLKNLYNLIHLQDYTNIKEWIIVEGSKNAKDADLNKVNIHYLKQLKESLSPFKIKYTGATYLKI